jgi:hypothetical protein
MSRGKFEVIQAVPGSNTLSRLVKRFGKNEIGIVTSLNDRLLSSINRSLDDETLVDVKPFGEVVRQVYLQSGIGKLRIESSRQSLSTLGMICNELGAASPFRAVAEFPGFHESLAKLIKEFEHFGLFSHEVHELSAKVSPELGRKLEDIATIASKSETFAEQSNAISVSRMMMASFDEHLDLDGQENRLLVFAESEFHPMAMKWLKWLSEEGAEVQVIFDRHATNGKIFDLAHRAIEHLGVKASLPGEGNQLTNRLFCESTPEEIVGSELEWVEIHKSGDLLSECEWAIRKCQSLGPTAKVAIFCRGMDRYAPILRATSQQFDVPLIIRHRVPLMTNGYAKFLVSQLESFLNRDVRNLSLAMRTSYVGIQIEARLQAAHEARLEQWNRLRELVSTESEEASDRYLYHILAARENSLRQDRTPAEWHAWLKEFIESSPVFENLATSPTHERDQRAYTAMLSSLAQDALAWISAQSEPISFRFWLEHATKIWEESTVSQPSDTSGIEVVSQPAELFDVDYLLVLGLLEGTFPRRRSEEPILSDDDRAEINEYLKGTKLLNSFDVARSERDLFYRVCCAAQKGLYLSYPATNDDSESDSVPAFYIDEVEKSVSNSVTIHHSRRELFPTNSSDLNPRDELLKMSFESPYHPPQSNEVHHAQHLIKVELATLRPAERKAVLDCGYRIAAQRVFPAPQRENESWNSLLRLVRRSNLFSVKTPEDARKNFAECMETFLDDLRLKVPEWEYDMILHGADRMIPKLIEQEFAARELWRRDVKNTIAGVKFGDPELPVDKYKFEETVPAVTIQGNIKTVHLFRMKAPKSGSNSKSKIDQERFALLAEFSPYFHAGFTTRHIPRVEIQGLDGSRTLLVFTSGEARPIQSETLLVENLADNDGGWDEFCLRLKDIRIALKQQFSDDSLKASPGNHCYNCNYADLCRRSALAPEDDDPFGLDQTKLEDED